MAKTPPSEYLTWGNLQKTPAFMTDDHLDGLDWDTIPGLLDWVDKVTTMQADLLMAVNKWAKNENYDTFCPDGKVCHNLALALILSPNTEPSIEPLNSILQDFVFSVLVVFKPSTQNTCNIYNGINHLVGYFEKGTPAVGLISLCTASEYYLYPQETALTDYAIISADNNMAKSSGPASSFIFGRLLHVIVNEVTNVILPPAFGKDINSLGFDWVPCPK